ncbi:MAG: hypothetical protein GX275_02690 [Clostridiales bacterium]|nr:hypothetical protein [Clostridiales bacterium]
MYNYKINENDLAELLIHQMNKNKQIKITLNVLICFFSISLVSTILYCVSLVFKSINFFVVIGLEIIIVVLLVYILSKNYKGILAKIYRREVNKNSAKYDTTIELNDNGLEICKIDSEDLLINKDFTCEKSDNAFYVYSNNRIIIIPYRIFKNKGEKNKFYDKLICFIS